MSALTEKEYFMLEAIKEAKKAIEVSEIPVGVVIVKDGEIIARAHNMREITQNATHHAEILAINEACEKLNSWRLSDCDMYVTLEPCVMCAGALILARIRKLYYGAKDERFGGVESIFRILDSDKFNHKVEYEGGIFEEECRNLMISFFQNLRNKKKIDKSE